jgi:protein TonB
LVKVSIDEAGKVTDAQVERATADQVLIDSAIDAAMKWTFEPAVRYGSPVPSSIVIPFNFKGKQ